MFGVRSPDFLGDLMKTDILTFLSSKVLFHSNGKHLATRLKATAQLQSRGNGTNDPQAGIADSSAFFITLPLWVSSVICLGLGRSHSV